MFELQTMFFRYVPQPSRAALPRTVNTLNLHQALGYRSSCVATISARHCSTSPITKQRVEEQTSADPSASLKAIKKLKKKGTLHPSITGAEYPSRRRLQAGSPSSTSWFVAHRERTLRDLVANNNDKSNAGRVDPLILPAVELINSFPHYCTASSCSGRVSVFHRAMPAPSGSANVLKPAEEPSSALSPDVVMANKKRGAGLGTIYSSHDPVSDTRAVAEQVYRDLVRARVPITVTGHHDGYAVTSKTTTAPHALAELLQVKFEPTILHTTCATMADAHRFIGASSDSGHRSTGIVVSRAGREASVNGAVGEIRKDSSGEMRGTKEQPSTLSVDSKSLGHSSAADSASTEASAVGSAKSKTNDVDALEKVGAGWKITAKMQSMINFDAPLYTATSGWLGHGGHLPLPDVFTDPSTATAEEKTIASNFINMLDQLLKHGNSLFVENEARRERFIVALREAEALAEKRKQKH